MKVLLLSDTYSEHTEKWAIGLADSGIQIGLFSFNKASYEWHNHPNITLFFEPEKKINAERTITKLAYFKYVNILKKIIKHFNPDILHAHYATSYGIIGALSGFHPFVISVWGSDVYDFPKRSKLHKKIFQYNLKKADMLMSTSHIMKTELEKYTNKEVIVTPFGVNVKDFCKKEVPAKLAEVIHVGTIKPIEEKYGIIYIIEAARILIDRNKDKKFKFYLIGPGNDLAHYQKLVDEKKLNENFEITGRIPFNEISNYHNLLDVFLNVSIDDSESFGVAAVEAMACEKPVIVSNVGGLMEVINHGEFGLIVPRKNAQAIAEAIEEVISKPAYFIQMGAKARKHVLDTYDWESNLNLMIHKYNTLMQFNEKTIL